MENTSLGYHTFAFFQKTNVEEYQLLENDFIGYKQETKKLQRRPAVNKDEVQIGWEFTYKDKKDKGIRWLLLSSKAKNNYVTRGVLAVINPKKLIENNYIVAAVEDDLKEVGEIYNREAEKISKVLLKFGACSLNRVDPCLNIDLKELGFPCTPEQMMKLIKRGNIPPHYKEREEFNEKQRRMIADKDSFYLESKSSVINYYWKYQKVKKSHPDYWNRESFRNVIRLELQCKYLKLYALSKNIQQESKYYVPDETLSLDKKYMRMCDGIYNPVIPIDVVLSEKVYESIIRKNIYRVLRKGDYFTLDIAKDIVKSYQYGKSKEDKMIHALKLVSKYHGIEGAKSTLEKKERTKFSETLRYLDKIFVNPVTIPRRWNIKHIPNLYQAYYDAKYEEQLVPNEEYYARKRIEEILDKVEEC